MLNSVCSRMITTCRCEALAPYWTSSVLLLESRHLCPQYHPTCRSPPIPLSLGDGLCSGRAGVERPICGLISLCWRAVNTHFCGCQFGEGGQPCGTQCRPRQWKQSGLRGCERRSFLFVSRRTMLSKRPCIDLRADVLCDLSFLSPTCLFMLCSGGETNDCTVFLLLWLTVHRIYT